MAGIERSGRCTRPSFIPSSPSTWEVLCIGHSLVHFLRLILRASTFSTCDSTQKGNEKNKTKEEPINFVHSTIFISGETKDRVKLIPPSPPVCCERERKLLETMSDFNLTEFCEGATENTDVAICMVNSVSGGDAVCVGVRSTSEGLSRVGHLTAHPRPLCLLTNLVVALVALTLSLSMTLPLCLVK